MRKKSKLSKEENCGYFFTGPFLKLCYNGNTYIWILQNKLKRNYANAGISEIFSFSLGRDNKGGKATLKIV